MPVDTPPPPVEALKFEAFPSIARYSRNCTITEKIDGTNAQILFQADGTYRAGSRNRWLEGSDDNMGFNAWVSDNKEELFALLGEGRHFGEWWGSGIQRRYGTPGKNFSLFNSKRWAHIWLPGYEKIIGGVPVKSVPVLADSINFCTTEVERIMADLKTHGSYAAPGFMNPEGIVIYHHAARVLLKKTFEHDETGKGETV